MLDLLKSLYSMLWPEPPKRTKIWQIWNHTKPGNTIRWWSEDAVGSVLIADTPFNNEIEVGDEVQAEMGCEAVFRYRIAQIIRCEFNKLSIRVERIDYAKN